MPHFTQSKFAFDSEGNMFTCARGHQSDPQLKSGLYAFNADFSNSLLIFHNFTSSQFS